MDPGRALEQRKAIGNLPHGHRDAAVDLLLGQGTGQRAEDRLAQMKEVLGKLEIEERRLPLLEL